MEPGLMRFTLVMNTSVCVMWRGNKNVRHLHVYISLCRGERIKPHEKSKEMTFNGIIIEARHFCRMNKPHRTRGLYGNSVSRIQLESHPVRRRWPWKSQHFQSLRLQQSNVFRTTMLNEQKKIPCFFRTHIEGSRYWFCLCDLNFDNAKASSV